MKKTVLQPSQIVKQISMEKNAYFHNVGYHHIDILWSKIFFCLYNALYLNKISKPP